jgi:hypothetical protein
MPSYTVTYGDDKPSSPSNKFANPAHGIMGVLGTSGSDPRERGRKRSRSEIEEGSREATIRKKERLAKVKEMRDSEKSGEAEKKTSKARAKVVARPDVQAELDRNEEMRLSNEARKNKPLERLTPEQQQIRMAEIVRSRELAKQDQARADSSDTLGLLQAQNRESPGLSEYLQTQQRASAPYVAKAASDMATRYASQPMAMPPAEQPKPERRRVAAQVPEVAPDLTAVSQGMASTAQKPARQRNLISDAFSVPGTPPQSMKFSPRRQEEEMQRSQFSGRGMGESMPNQIMGELGRTVKGLATEGPGFFNAEGYEFEDAEAAKQKFLQDRERQAEIDQQQMELDQLLTPMSRNQMNRFTPPGGFIGASYR